MAQKINVVLVDDLDGTAADETVQFGLDGKRYEIELSADNAKELREGLAEYIAASRKAGGGNPTPRRSNGARPRTSSTSVIRDWAATAGYSVSARGRVPEKVVAAYNAAKAAESEPVAVGA